jgi:hypothetical protein
MQQEYLDMCCDQWHILQCAVLTDLQRLTALVLFDGLASKIGMYPYRCPWIHVDVRQWYVVGVGKMVLGYLMDVVGGMWFKKSEGPYATADFDIRGAEAIDIDELEF